MCLCCPCICLVNRCRTGEQCRTQDQGKAKEEPIAKEDQRSGRNENKMKTERHTPAHATHGHHVDNSVHMKRQGCIRQDWRFDKQLDRRDNGRPKASDDGTVSLSLTHTHTVRLGIPDLFTFHLQLHCSHSAKSTGNGTLVPKKHDPWKLENWGIGVTGNSPYTE